VPNKESISDRLHREAAELRETALDLMEHASLLITKSGELHKEITKHEKAQQGKKK